MLEDIEVLHEYIIRLMYSVPSLRPSVFKEDMHCDSINLTSINGKLDSFHMVVVIEGESHALTEWGVFINKDNTGFYFMRPGGFNRYWNDDVLVPISNFEERTYTLGVDYKGLKSLNLEPPLGFYLQTLF